MNYYNENDPKAAAWLRELIKAGQIPAGSVDERSIVDVQPGDLNGFTQCHFFAGIGGWSYALGLAGWPESRPVWTGSCPCQPFSVAGEGLAEADPRHLWPEFYRLIGARKPPVVFGEQVASKAGRVWLSGVFADLEALGYSRAGADLCAAGVNAPHIRQRLFWVSRTNGERLGRKHPLLWPEAQGWPTPRILKAAGGGSPSWLPNAQHAVGGPEHQEHGETHGRDGLGGCGDTGTIGVGDSLKPGLEGHPGYGDNGNQPGWLDTPAHGSVTTAGSPGYWDTYEVLQFRDGKARRIEPGTFPLAHGIPGRVGLLRGYGNAIVPQVAAEFIKAVDDITTISANQPR
jgi:DNA (cytosine-5)-methyltransferase 1